MTSCTMRNARKPQIQDPLLAAFVEVAFIISMASDGITSGSITSSLSCPCTIYAFFYDRSKLFPRLSENVKAILQHFLFTTNEITNIPDFRQLKMLTYEARQKDWTEKESSFLVHTLKEIMKKPSYSAWLMLGLELILISLHRSLDRQQNVTPLYDAMTQTYPSFNFLLTRLKPRSCKSALLHDSYRRLQFSHQQLVQQLQVLRRIKLRCNRSTF